MANEMDKVVALLAGANTVFPFIKTSQSAEGAATWHSLWKAGLVPAAGANPPLFSSGSGYSPTDATTGSFLHTNSATQKRLAKMSLIGSTVGTLILYDRLWACSGFATNITTAQNITSPGTIPSRDANGAALGAGVELWGEVYAAPGATGATWTASYTDQDGNAGNNATYTHPANAESVGQMFMFNLAAGDTGVRAVASLTCSVSSGTAGDIGLTLLRRVAEIPIPLVNVAQVLDFAALGFPRIYDDACLALMVQCSATNTGLIHGSFVMGDYTP
jgi:hypothetical protein